MLNFALIGTGAWGKNYITAVKELSNCRIKYICSKNSKSLDLFQGDYVKITDYKKLLTIKDIDGVIIATPNSTHFQICQQFIKNRNNLLIEKPMVENYSQALTLESLQKNSGSKIIIGHNYLFDPAYRKTKQLAKSIGKIRYISYEGTNNGPCREGTSVLWDIGSHAVSLCLDINPKKPVQISAFAVSSLMPGTKFYDLAIIKIMFEDKTEAFIKVSWLFPVKRRELIIVGDKDTIVYDAVADKKIIYYKNMVKNFDIKIKNTKVSFPKYGKSLSLPAEINEFAEAILKNKDVKISNLEFGINITKIITLAYKSIAHNGKPELI